LLIVSLAWSATDSVTVQSSQSIPVRRPDAFERNSVAHCVRASDQTMHCVFTDNEGQANRVMYIKSADNGQTWTAPSVISTGYTKPREPMIVVDATDTLFVFYENNGSMYLTESTDRGDSWSTPFKVSGRFSEGKSPAAVAGTDGTVYLVWENAGTILYRSYTRASSTWGTITDITKTMSSASAPVIALLPTGEVYVAWLERGEAVGKVLDPQTEQWSEVEQISLDANRRLQTRAGACDGLTITVDGSGAIHAAWINGTQILHRMRVKKYWSPIISRLSKSYMRGLAQPSIVSDHQGLVYIGYSENNKVIINQFDAKNVRWDKTKRLSPRGDTQVFSVQLSGTETGYDLAWVEKHSSYNLDGSVIVFQAKASVPKVVGAPDIISVANQNGYPFVSWSTKENQVGAEVVIASQAQPGQGLMYDSKKIDTGAMTYLIMDFNIRPLPMYFFVRTLNDRGQWSAWSSPYLYKALDDNDGPELTITGIEEDSINLFSPNSSLLYYGPGLTDPKTFIIKGKAKDMGSGVKKIVFAPAFGNAPPPLYDLRSGDWQVRYSIQAEAEPATIVITAYDNNGKTTSKIVSVVKDATPPEPPSWVRVFSNKDQTVQSNGKLKFGKARTIYASWVDGKDAESGVRYQVMGINKKWWQNPVHKSGDAEDTDEGLNTIYVFAVDNVGNVSNAGTDTIFIDSIAPLKPSLREAVTSGNYFYGTKTDDTVRILVNGMKDEDVEMVSSYNWRYKHNLRDGQSEQYQFQAIDGVGNKSEVLEVRLGVDRTPPHLYYAEHNAEDTLLRVKDTLVVTAKAENGSQVWFSIDGLVAAVPMYDDGTRGDIKAYDGVYTGRYQIDTELPVGKVDVDVFAGDSVGNVSHIKTVQPVVIDSTRPIKLDDFEANGDQYPWKNHCQAENISATDALNSALGIPEGNGCLKMTYDFQHQQSWAACSSRERVPKNLFGSRAYLSFWLKGSGSRTARMFIYLEGKNKRDVVLQQKDRGITYSVSLGSSSWQKIILPIADEYLDDLIGFTKYTVYVFSDNEDEQGECYIDDLQIMYKGTGEMKWNKAPAAFRQKALSNTPTVVATKKIMPPPLLGAPEPDTTTFVNAPYLPVELSPQPALRGKPLTITIKLAADTPAELVYVTLGDFNGAVQKVKLKKVSSLVWRGTYPVPGQMLEGERYGQVMIRTVEKHLLKKQFVFKVVDPGNAVSVEQTTLTMFPHPALPGVDVRIAVRIPESVKASKIMLFFGEDQENVYSIDLGKSGIEQGIEVWRGIGTIPVTLKPGEHTARLFIKTRDNRFYKKQTIYTVIGR
jgi:hypothetical protein